MVRKRFKQCEICERDTISKCSKCGKNACLKHLYCYVDESNIAITNNAPLLCAECYKKIYCNKV